MHYDTHKPPRELGNRELLKKLRELLQKDHRLEVQLIEHIGEVDRRKLYRQHAYSSMFQFCVCELHLSEATAYKRIGVSRAARQFRRLLDAIGQGKLHLTAASLLAPKLTTANQEKLIEAAEFKSKRQVEKLLAQWFPQPDVFETIRKLPVPAAQSQSQAESTLQAELAKARAAMESRTKAESNALSATADLGLCESVASTMESSVARTVFQPTNPPPARVRPLAQDRFKIQFTASQRLVDKIDKTKALLGPKVGANELEVLFERAVDALIAEVENKKHGVTQQPKSPSSSKVVVRKRSRYIPRAVRREVYARDAGQCAFMSADGRRCEERWGLEYHHRQPFGLGGESTVSNLELRCRCHNGLAAEEDFGGAKMKKYAQPQLPKTDRVYEARVAYRLGSVSTGSGASYSHAATGVTAIADIDAAARGQRHRAATAQRHRQWPRHPIPPDWWVRPEALLRSDTTQYPRPGAPRRASPRGKRSGAARDATVSV